MICKGGRLATCMCRLLRRGVRLAAGWQPNATRKEAMFAGPSTFPVHAILLYSIDHWKCHCDVRREEPRGTAFPIHSSGTVLGQNVPVKSQQSTMIMGKVVCHFSRCVGARFKGQAVEGAGLVPRRHSHTGIL